MAMLWFYCDESYKSQEKPPKAYMVSGFVAEERTWSKVEKGWQAINKRRGLSRFHAASLNALSDQYAGWTAQRSKRYTKALLEVLTKQKLRLHVISVGILVRDYERIISTEGRRKFGQPYLVCFKSCVTQIVAKMEHEGWGRNWLLSVIFERNEFQNRAVKLFYAMKDHPGYPYRHRLATCAPGSPEQFIALQPADLIAYEACRYLRNKEFGDPDKVRKALRKMFAHNAFSGYYYNAQFLEDMKPELEASTCGPDCYIPTHWAKANVAPNRR